MTAIATRDVQLGDLHFPLSESGNARSEAVLWLHGSGPGATALSNREGVIGDLAGDFHNLAPDVIGFGDSSHPDPAPRGMLAFTKLWVETLLRLLDTLGLERVHLVGNSMGGMISLGLVSQAA